MSTPSSAERPRDLEATTPTPAATATTPTTTCHRDHSRRRRVTPRQWKSWDWRLLPEHRLLSSTSTTTNPSNLPSTNLVLNKDLRPRTRAINNYLLVLRDPVLQLVQADRVVAVDQVSNSRGRRL